MKYFIQEHLHRETFDGGIGNVDMEKVFVSQGYKPLQAPYHFVFTWKAKILRFLFAIKTFFSLPSGSQIVFQFPLYARIHILLIRLLLLRKNVFVICLIADIDGIRDGDQELLKKEIKQLKKFKFIIVHNQEMQQWLYTTSPKAKSAVLNFFPFLAKPFAATRQRSKTPEIAFAGNPLKARFIEKLHQLEHLNIVFAIYGMDKKSEGLQDNISYKGIFKPYDLPQIIKSDFGLIWDGDSITECGGSYGQYLLFNTPHKISLCILSRLPVIAWERAAIAPLIKKYKIGITVKSLFEIEDKIKDLPDKEYEQMIENMAPLIESISSGNTLVNALEEISGSIANKKPGGATGA